MFRKERELECDMRREMKCGIDCDSCPRNVWEKVWHRQHIMPTNRGIKELSDLALFTKLLGFSLCVFLSGAPAKRCVAPI